MKSCLICDDHGLMREALAGAVRLVWPQACVTLAQDYPSAWAAMECMPDLCVSDLVMPGASPIEGIRQLRGISPSTPILVVTGNEDDIVLLELFTIGVAGFAPKTSKSEVIEAAIRLVLAGGRYMPPRILEIAAQRAEVALPNTLSTPKVRLTPRQIDVLKLIALGQSNKEIARKLDLSPATIKAHAAAAIAAMGASNRTEAVVKAQAMGAI